MWYVKNHSYTMLFAKQKQMSYENCVFGDFCDKAANYCKPMVLRLKLHLHLTVKVVFWYLLYACLQVKVRCTKHWTVLIRLQWWKPLHVFLFTRTQGCICQSAWFCPLSISPPPTHTPIYVLCRHISPGAVCCVYMCIFSHHPYYLTEAWHNPDSKPRAVSSKEMAREPISISYNKLAAFDIVFSFHQQLTGAPTTCNLQSGGCAVTWHRPWQSANSEPPTARLLSARGVLTW